MTNEDVAAAISGHRFDAAIPHFADKIEWEVVGRETLRGAEAVAAACRQTQKQLVGVETTFHEFMLITSRDCVVVESRADYVAASGTSSVASCDIYVFDGDLLVKVTSYLVEL
jgi:limonene-1,2-epoxide hydrolase